MSWQSGLEHCLRPDEPMAEHCWLRLGGPAEFFAEPANEEDLQLLHPSSTPEEAFEYLKSELTQLYLEPAGQD